MGFSVTSLKNEQGFEETITYKAWGKTKYARQTGYNKIHQTRNYNATVRI